MKMKYTDAVVLGSTTMKLDASLWQSRDMSCGCFTGMAFAAIGVDLIASDITSRNFQDPMPMIEAAVLAAGWDWLIKPVKVLPPWLRNTLPENALVYDVISWLAMTTSLRGSTDTAIQWIREEEARHELADAARKGDGVFAGSSSEIAEESECTSGRQVQQRDFSIDASGWSTPFETICMDVDLQSVLGVHS